MIIASLISLELSKSLVFIRLLYIKNGESNMKILIILVFNMLICFILIADTKQPHKVKIKCAGCKTEYYLIKALAKPFKTETSIKLAPAKSGNKIAMQLLIDNKISFAFTCKSLSVLQKHLNLPEDKVKQWKCIKIATDPLVISVNNDIGVKKLTVKQLSDIYTLKITNWKELGGKDLPIKITSLAFSVQTGVNIALNELLQCKDAPIPKSFFTFDSPRKVGDFISKTPGAIGCFALKSYKVRYGKLMDIDNVCASAANIKNGSYPLFVTYYLIYNPNDKDKTGKFLSFIKTKKGKEAINKIMVAE